MEIGISTMVPLFKTWYFAFIENEQKQKSWCRLQIIKNGELFVQQIKHKKAVRSAWHKEPEIVQFQFCGTNYQVLIPNPDFIGMPQVSK
ncbi:MAG: hypothetical protein M3P22_01350 [bacterium]|nr:hypothetical protein [bacterium]